MEFTRRGQSTASANDDDDGHRPPPLHGVDAGPAQGDVAARARRREMLLGELHKERIRQEMILRELAETERARAARFAAGHQPTPTPTFPCPPRDWLSTPAAARDAWCDRPSMPPWGEKAPFRSARSSERPSYWRGSPTAVRVPVYPHVERSPSPTPQPRPADDAEQQERGRSSRSSARAPSVHPDVEQCRSVSSKEPAVEEALVPGAAIADAKPTEPALLSEEVAPERRAAIGQERDEKAQESRAVPLLDENGNRSSEQPKPTESIIGDGIDERVLLPRQYRPAGQENSTFDEQKRLEFSEPTPKMAPSGLKRRLTAETSPVKKQKPLGKWSCNLCQVNTTCDRNLAQHRAGQLHWSNLAALQSRRKIAELNTKSAPESSHGAHGKNKEPPSKSDLRDQLRARRHRENTEALHAEGKNEEAKCASNRVMDKRSLHFCEACGVQCNSKKMLESHLGGRRHRDTLQGRH